MPTFVYFLHGPWCILLIYLNYRLRLSQSHLPHHNTLNTDTINKINILIRLGGFWGLFFNSILPQNSDGDFVSGNHKKNFLVIRKFFVYQKWQFKNSNLHYMSFFQSCWILTFYSLKWPSQLVGSENIYVRGFLIYCLGDTASDRVQKGHIGLGSPCSA